MTAQVSDILIYENERHHLQCEPLESYLKETELPHKLVPTNSACWRGYIATWAIDNKKLFLIKWEAHILDYVKVDIDYLFPGEEFVFAKWFTGKIKIPMGECVKYVHGGYLSVYEGQKILTFENGIMIDEVTKWLSQEEIVKIQEVNKDLPF
ncbi:MAG: hypothetical protein EA362_11945 [Saprospirales bacterium]|nr:MAG: hypothetical protein EA362_11945 [Saprospirales bacterium]